MTIMEKKGSDAVHEYLVNGGQSCMAGFVLKILYQIMAELPVVSAKWMQRTI